MVLCRAVVSWTGAVLDRCENHPNLGAGVYRSQASQEVAKLVSNLSVGFASTAAAERVLPGIIGEVHLSCGAASLFELRVCVEAQRRTGAPLLLSGPVSEEAFEILGGASASGPCLWCKCAIFDVPADSPVKAQRLWATGMRVGLCPPTGGADVSRGPYFAQRPWRTEGAFLEELASIPRDQCLVSSGLRFRTDLTAAGGPGLSHLPDLLHGRASREELRRVAVEFLRYPWKPPPQKQS